MYVHIASMATERLTKLGWLHNWIIFLATSVTKMLDHNKFGQCLSQTVIVYGDGITLHIKLCIVGWMLVQYVSPINLFLGQLRKGYLMLRTPCNMLRIIAGFFA